VSNFFAKELIKIQKKVTQAVSVFLGIQITQKNCAINFRFISQNRKLLEICWWSNPTYKNFNEWN